VIQVRLGTGVVVWVGLRVGKDKDKYNVKTCMCTISPLYQIINFNVST